MLVKAICLALTVSGLSAAITIDNTKLKKIVVAKDKTTRFTIADKHIKTVIVYPDKYSKKFKLHSSGHLFVNSHGIEEPVKLTIISHTGELQDLELTTSKAKEAHPIIFKIATKKIYSENDFNIWLRSSKAGLTPSGFDIIGHKTIYREQSALKAQSRTVFTNGEYNIVEFEVKGSDSSLKIDLFAKLMWQAPNDVALSFNRKVLQPGESAKLFVIQKLNMQK